MVATRISLASLPHLQKRKQRKDVAATETIPSVYDLLSSVQNDLGALDSAYAGLVAASLALSAAEDVTAAALAAYETNQSSTNAQAYVAAVAAQQTAQDAYDAAISLLMAARTQLSADQAALDAALNALLGG